MFSSPLLPRELVEQELGVSGQWYMYGFEIKHMNIFGIHLSNKIHKTITIIHHILPFHIYPFKTQIPTINTFCNTILSFMNSSPSTFQFPQYVHCTYILFYFHHVTNKFSMSPLYPVTTPHEVSMHVSFVVTTPHKFSMHHIIIQPIHIVYILINF